MDFGSSCQALHDGLLGQLITIKRREQNVVRMAMESLGACRLAVNQLHEYINLHAFSSIEEKVKYFKETEPYFRSRLIYFTRLFWLETGRPSGDRTFIEDYFQKEWRFIRDFDLEHSFIRRYMRAGAVWLDEKLFLHPPIEDATDVLDYTSTDPLHYNAPNIIAHLMAHDLMQDYLINATEELKQPDDRTFKNLSRLNWTDSKAALIELGYAIKSANSLNDGKAELKDIMECLQTVFHIDLGHYHRTFQEILSRKSGYTTYIKKLDNKLLLYINLIEQRHDPK